MLGTSETWWSWGDLHRLVAAQTSPWALGGPGSKWGQSDGEGRLISALPPHQAEAWAPGAWGGVGGAHLLQNRRRALLPPTQPEGLCTRLFLPQPGPSSRDLVPQALGHSGETAPSHLDQGCDVSALPQRPAHCPQRPGWLPKQIHVAQLQSRALQWKEGPQSGPSPPGSRPPATRLQAISFPFISRNSFPWTIPLGGLPQDVRWLSPPGHSPFCCTQACASQHLPQPRA